MSNIVVSEEQILNAEECRVIQRTNLRNQGVACSDNESMRSLVGKTSNIQSWVKFVNKTLSGAIYDDTITSSISNLFNGFNLLTHIIMTGISAISVDNFKCGSLKVIILPNIVSMSGTSNIGYSGSLEVIVFPRYTGTSAQGLDSQKVRVADYGSISALSKFTVSGARDFNKFILRKTDSAVPLSATSVFNNTPFNQSNGNGILYIHNSIKSTYENGTNWSALLGTSFVALEGSRFEDLDWWETVYNQDGTPKNTCTLDGNLIETADNETVAIFKHTENISHCYENGVELQDTDLVKGKTLTSTI